MDLWELEVATGALVILGTAHDTRMVCTHAAALVKHTSPLVVHVPTGTPPFTIFAIVLTPPVAANSAPVALFPDVPPPPAAASPAPFALSSVHVHVISHRVDVTHAVAAPGILRQGHPSPTPASVGMRCMEERVRGRALLNPLG